jgi:endogenous inhibitor of DNA gyrase (YacG/DUF329 family)
MKQCKECGVQFEPKNGKGVFCSKKCKQKDYRKSVAGKLKLYDQITQKAKNTEIGKRVMEQVSAMPSSLTIRNISPTGTVLSTHKLINPEVNIKGVQDRIDVLKREIAKPPEKLSIPKRVYIKLRQDELDELENKVKS